MDLMIIYLVNVCVIPSLGSTNKVVDEVANVFTFTEFIKQIRYSDGEMVLKNVKVVCGDLNSENGLT